MDDGSIDSSLDILKKYENADVCFIVHHRVMGEYLLPGINWRPSGLLYSQLFFRKVVVDSE